MAEPKVRFKRDDGSSYPAWTAGKLGDITEKVDRKAPKGSTAPVMMVSQGNGFIYQADKYSRENAGQSLKNYTLLKKGEFAYNHGASKAKPYGVAYCLNEEQEARVPFVYHTFKIMDGVDSYWHEALNTSKMDRQLKRMVSSGARMDGLLNINYETYMDVRINIPCLEEQQKIADFLSSVDEVITASEEEVANLETQKKAVMKKIFSQEVRFIRDDGSDFPEWEEKKLGGYCDIVTGKLDANAMVEDGAYDFYTSGIATYKIDIAAFEGPAITIAGNGATVGYMHLADGKFNAYQRTYVLSQFRALREYLFYAIGDRLPLKIRKEARAGNIPYIVMDMLTDLYIPLPCEEEQRLIADFLSDFDEAIAAAKKELELWKELKKGLLQQMFV